METAELHRRAVEGFGELVPSVCQDQWHGAIAPPPEIPAGVDDRTVLLAMFGRRARP